LFIDCHDCFAEVLQCFDDIELVDLRSDSEGRVVLNAVSFSIESLQKRQEDSERGSSLGCTVVLEDSHTLHLIRQPLQEVHNDTCEHSSVIRPLEITGIDTLRSIFTADVSLLDLS
jgi:hypothetical protein